MMPETCQWLMVMQGCWQCYLDASCTTYHISVRAVGVMFVM